MMSKGSELGLKTNAGGPRGAQLWDVCIPEKAGTAFCGSAHVEVTQTEHLQSCLATTQLLRMQSLKPPATYTCNPG